MDKILFLSDSHTFHHEIPKDWLVEADAICHSGDVSLKGTEKEIKDFLEWYSGLNYKYKIMICGNHDWLFETNPGLVKNIMPDNIIYLQDSGVEIEGIKFWGSPVQPWFNNWAFNRNRGENIKKHWDLIPLDTNILLTHGPLHGILDMTLEGDLTGCKDLLNKVGELKKLKVFSCGHIHEARGAYEFADGMLCINCSIVNRSYYVINRPYLVDTETWKVIKHDDK